MNFTAVSGITLVGLRPPGVPPRNRHTTSATGRASTYQERNAVQTKPATSLLVRGADAAFEQIMMEHCRSALA